MHRPFRHFASATALLALSALSAAHADTIDFESVDLQGIYLPGDSFISGAFSFSTLSDFGIIDTAIGLGGVAPSGNATQFYFNSNSGALSVARTDGQAFSLVSFAAAFVPLDPPSLQTTVLVATGITSEGATVSATFSFASSLTTSFPFSSYTAPGSLGSVVSVSFKACSLVGGLTCTEPTLNNGQFAIDNIQLAPVPEPTSALLLTLGLVGLGLRARRTTR